MAIPDALIRRVTLHATADDAGNALRVLHAAEAAVRRAVEAAATSIGNEVLVLRKLSLDFAVDLDGRHALAAPQMQRALQTAIVRPIQRARGAPSGGPAITEHAAWFPSEASAIAELLAAYKEGRASAWPYQSLTLWGTGPDDLLRGCLERDRVLLGDVLAAAIRRLDANGLLGLIGDELANAIVAVYSESSSDRTLAASSLPVDLRIAIAADLARLTSVSPAQRDLLTLARLFALWPPARDARIPLVELRLLAAPAMDSSDATSVLVLADLLHGTGANVARLPADIVATLIALLRGSREGRNASLEALWERMGRAGIPADVLRRAVEGALLKRHVSAAGGLVAWAALFAAEGLWAEIDEAYPEPRAQRAVRWAIGCALEDARIGGIDPTLFLWAGEDMEVAIAPKLALGAADPEWLHGRALRLAATRGLLSAPLDAASFGDTVTLTGEDGFCVDAIVGEDVDRALPALVRRFSSRVGRPPAAIRVAEQMSGEAVDALVEVDVPQLTEAWRVAIRALASMARSSLFRRWRTPMGKLRGWPAIVEIGRWDVVEILRSDVSRVAGGGWLRDNVQMGGRIVTVRTK